MHDLLLRRRTPPVHIEPAHAPNCQGPEDGARYGDPCQEWCHSHNQCEPFDARRDYMVCSECLHVFRTPGELIRSHLLLLQKLSMDWPYEGDMDDYGRLPKKLTLRTQIDPAEIHSCPHCAHDL